MGLQTGVGCMTVDQAQDVDAMRDVAVRLSYMIGQITPEEFRWQDANYDRDSALGRELLYLIAENQWVRATSETIDIARSDMVETTIQIDIELGRITHEAFRGRAGKIWLPILVLPPLLQRVPELDPFSALTVRDAAGARLPTLPDTDVQHRVAAALTEIIVNMAEARLPEVDDQVFSATRSHRLMLSAAVYRLLGSEHVPTAVMTRRVPARHDDDGPLPRFARVRRDLGDLVERFSGLLSGTDSAGQDDAAAERSALARQLAFRAIQLLRAFTESAIVVIAAERGHAPTVLTVTVPSRPLHWAASGQAEPGQRAGSTRGMRTRLLSWRWLRPANWILPGACLKIDLLLPSADADRHIQVNLPDEISPDPSRPLGSRARLAIRTGPPLIRQLGELMNQLADASEDWPPALYQCLADLAGAKADAALESLRDYRVAAAAGETAVTSPTSPAPTHVTQKAREQLGTLREALRSISAHEEPDEARARLMRAWRGGTWLPASAERRVSTDIISPGVVVARARMIDDVNQRAAPSEATIQIQVALTDAVNFSVASIAGSASILLMAVVLGFFLFHWVLPSSSREVSPEVLAIVLTLFSAIQAGRLGQATRSTMHGLLTPAGNPLILVSIVPSVILAVALAFSLTAIWAVTWASACITVQLLLLSWQWLLLRRSLSRGLAPPDRAQLPDSPTLYTDGCDYSHSEVLHSRWWRKTVADALMVGRQSYGYVIWQHGTPQNPQTLRSLLRGSRPAGKAVTSLRLQAPRLALGRRSSRSHNQPDLLPAGRSSTGQASGGNPETRSGNDSNPAAEDADPGVSPLEQPANVLALQRSGAGTQSVTFAIFRDRPDENWDCAPEDVIRVDLDPGHLATREDPVGVVGVFLGLPRGQRIAPVRSHPVTKVLRTAAQHHLAVLEIQLPVPAPEAAYADLLWARVQLGQSDRDLGKLTPFLDDVRKLAAGSDPSQSATGPQAAWPVTGIQTISEGIPRILNPRMGSASPGPDPGQANRPPLVLASDLDVVAAAGGAHEAESAAARTWRVMAIAAKPRMGVEHEILSTLPAGLELAGLTAATLHGKAVLLLLCHQPGGPAGPSDINRDPGHQGTRANGVTVYLDRWQSRQELGQLPQHPLLRVHMRTPDRPGATLAALESLRETLQEISPGALGERDWNVWYARVTVDSGDVGTIQLTARLALDPAAVLLPEEDHDVPTELSKIERKTLALAAHKMATTASADSLADNGLDITADMVISVGLVNMPDPWPLASL